MGLDSIELIVQVENAFGIRFSDLEAQEADTVGGLYELVWKHIRYKNTEACNSQFVFHRIRSAVTEMSGVDRQTGTPASDMNEFLRLPHRRLDYEWISLHCGLAFPALALLRPYQRILDAFAIVAIAFPAAAALLATIFFDASGYWFLLPLGGVLLCNLLSMAMKSKRQDVKPASLRLFVKEVLILNADTLARKNGLSRHEMETIVRDIIVLKTGADELEVIPTANFTEDLGID